MSSPGAILFAQFIFLATGVLSTCLAQFVFYMGAGDQRAMLLPLCNYLGMMLVGLVPGEKLGKAKKTKCTKKVDDLPQSAVVSCQSLPIPQTISRRQQSDTDSDADPSKLLEESTAYPPEFTHITQALPKTAVVLPAEANPSKFSVQSCIYLNVLLDFAGCIFSNIGLSMAGSGIFQVIYSSIVCWSALLSKTLLHKKVSRDEWVGIAVVTFGLAFSALGESGGSAKHHIVIIGSLNTLIGAGFYAGTYVAGEYTLLLPERPDPRDLCVKIGTICLGVIAVYMTIYALPNWHEFITFPIEESGGRTSAILLALVSYTLSQLAHSLTYFMMLESSGAVTTGIMQSLRAVCVFGLSSILYCSKQESQCFDTKRGVSTLIVVAGVLFYSYSKQQSTTSPNAKLKRRNRRRHSLQTTKNCVV